MRAYVVAFVFMLFAGVAEAQLTSQVDARQHHQRARIRKGISSGEINRQEAYGLRREQRHIRRTERRMKAEGQVSARERMILHRKQNIASRHIRRKRVH